MDFVNVSVRELWNVTVSVTLSTDDAALDDRLTGVAVVLRSGFTKPNRISRNILFVDVCDWSVHELRGGFWEDHDREDVISDFLEPLLTKMGEHVFC